MLVLKGLVGLHRTIQLQLLQHYWLRHRLGLLWYWLGADCGSDHELLIAIFRLKLKKVQKTTRSFRYDLNQIPYNYTVEVRYRFKGLDLIECLKNYGWRFVTLYSRQWSRPSSIKRNAKKAKWLSEEALEITGKEEKWKAKEKRKDIPFWMQSSND